MYIYIYIYIMLKVYKTIYQSAVKIIITILKIKASIINI